MFNSSEERSFKTQVAEGFVLLDGPWIAVTLTPKEALVIAEKLAAAATHAAGQSADT